MQTLFWIVSIIALAWRTATRDPYWILVGRAGSLLVVWLWTLAKSLTVTRILQSLSLTMLAWILATLSIVIYQRRYEQGTPLTSGARQGTITITNTRTHDVMIAEVDGRSYRYRTTQLWPLGSRLWVTGYVRDETLPLWRSPQEPLAPPIREGEMDRAGWLRMRGLHGTISPQHVIYQSTSDLGRAASTKARLLDHVGGLFSSPDREALLLGMLIGDRSGFEEESYQNFIDSGLVHIIAVSGGNLVMIMVFLGLILVWVPYRLRILIMGASVIAYAMIVGMDSSIFRAVIMSLLTMLALLGGRHVSVWRLIGISSLLMLWRDPYFLWHDIGFIFSYAALIGIILVRPRITQTRRYTRDQHRSLRLLGRIRGEYILPTYGATILVMPFLLLYTDSRNILSLLANLLVLPLVPLVMIGGLIATIISPWRGETRLSRLIDGLLGYIISISDRISAHGMIIRADVQWYPALLVLLITGYAIAMYRRGRVIDLQDD